MTYKNSTYDLRVNYMKINSINLKQNSYDIHKLSFNGVNVRGRKNFSQNSTAINQANKDISLLGQTSDLHIQNSANKKLENEMIERFREESNALHWFQMFKEIRLANQHTKEETNLKQKNNRIQEHNIKKLKSEIDEIPRILTTLKSKIKENDDAEIARIKELENLTIASFKDNKGFNQIAGYDEEKAILYRYFVSQILKKYNGENAEIPSSILFFGPQGNGKTTFATAFAQEIGCNKPISVKAFGLDTKRICANFYRNLMKCAEDSEKNYQKTGKYTVIFIDEIIKVIDEKSTILAELEEFLSTCAEKYHCIVFAATNYPLKINLPIKENREIFPFIVSMDPPDTITKAKILKYYLDGRTKEHVDNEIYFILAKLLEEKENSTHRQFSNAQIRNEICEADSDKEISFEELIAKIDSSIPTISEEQQNEYQNAMNELMEN